MKSGNRHPVGQTPWSARDPRSRFFLVLVAQAVSPAKLLILIALAVIIRAEIAPWVQHIPAGPEIAALFRTVPMPGGAIPILRTPREARPELTTLISTAPREATLYRLRAQEAELALDFAAAEADWKTYAQIADAHIDLADFYHRRGRPRDELAALTAASKTKDDPLQPATSQTGWHTFQRMSAVVEQDALPEAVAEPVYRAWVARYPKEPLAWRYLIEHLALNRQFAAAETEIARYATTFHDDFEPVRMRADLEMRRGSPDAAIATYDRAFQPLWPDEIRANYFKLLEQQGQLREFAGHARTALASNAADLNATARLFHYFRSQNNFPAARRTLLEYRIAKESGRQPWTADDLQTLAQLFEWLPDVNEAARLYYALYSVAPDGGPQTERALYGLANLLLTAPDQPIQFGSSDLSFYKDIATLDSSPGFLNGILSLLLNSQGPRFEYQNQNEKSAAYFHRAAASQLTTLLEQRFPQSQYRDPLRAQLVSAYGVYGDDATVIRAGREYLAAFPSGTSRVAVAMQISDALARGERTAEEFALYDQMLRELATKASGVPIGSNPPPAELDNQPLPPGPQPLDFRTRSPWPPSASPQPAPDSGARSAEYVQVLDKYLARLAAINRPLDALRVYRAEIDRNPNDPGLYQRLAGFLEQNNMSRDVESLYAAAIAKFNDRSWYHKLARWHLRHQQSGALEKITRDVIAIFSGSELEQYFAEIVTQTHPDAGLYRQLNLYAHQRFPEDLVFVRNLLTAYARSETSDDAAAERLLRQYWFYDPQLRSRFFERLSARGQLYPEIAQIRAANPGVANGQFDQALTVNPAAVEFLFEAEAWLSHFEAAAPAARSLAAAYPGRREVTAKASSLYRSLAAFDHSNTEISIAIAAYDQRSDPRDPSVLARIGDICADRELFARARTFWERMPAAQPGNQQSYLDTATIYWDYYRYNDALRWIAAARAKFNDPTLFAYQAGAIQEGRHAYAGAVREYAAGALAAESAANSRLLRLLSRPKTHDLVERATAAAVASDPSPQAVALRISVLEAEQRRPDLETFLQARVDAEKSSTELAQLQETARHLGFERIEQRASERLAAITNDPIDKMRLTLANAQLHESKKDVAGAATIIDTVYRDHPLILGVVRAAVDFHVRNRQPAEATDILLDSSKRARADLAAQFTLEAARISAQAGQFDRARTLLAGLLTADPLRAEYLTAMADTYLSAKDDRGFRDFQIAAIQRVKQSTLPPAQRVERIATIRRSLIPALDRLKDDAGAIDQYIEVVNSYPEDEALTKEAAAYAVAHNQAARMVAFYRKTIADAPLDYRWPIVLGRIETVTEDFPAAIADYERGIKARPDRADVVEAKAHLEERLMRFEDAIKSYTRLYELTYRDPEWLIKVAELRARTGQPSEAVTALKTAIIGARTETADADFAIAGHLESWHILPAAVAFAEKGAALAGTDLSDTNRYAETYTRIMALARRMEEILAPLTADNPATAQLVAHAAGTVVAETYTPEEKVLFEKALSAKVPGLGPMQKESILLPLAQSAGLVDLEARWRLESMQWTNIDPLFVTLQSSRGLYGVLGRQLEEFAAQHPGQPIEDNALVQSAQAYIAVGDVESQIRVMRKALARSALGGALLDRYLALMAARQPEELLTIIRTNSSTDIRNRAVQSAIASTQVGQAVSPASNHTELAYSAVRTRGAALPAVWTKAYTALAGLYFDDHAPSIDSAFQSALDTRTIGERLATPLKPDSIIVGSVWFYYGARYGDYLLAGKAPAADQWMPASLEAAPGNPQAYMTLGDSYAEAGQGAKAIAQFEHALELDSDRGDAHNHIARVLWSEGRRPEAIARWKSALATFLRVQSRGVRVPEPFWSRISETFTDIGQRHALGELRADIAHLLGDYYQRNNQYRLSELIDPAVNASIASGEGTAWLLELGRSMGDPDMILYALVRAPGLTAAQRISLQRDRVALIAKRTQASFGDSRESGSNETIGARVQLISMLLDAGDIAGASAEWSQIPAEPLRQSRYDSHQLRDMTEIRLASKTGTLESLLERYRTQLETAPYPDALRDFALKLRAEGDENSARSVLEFLYDREIRTGHLDAANFLGLAEVKLQRNDAATALALLNRMVLIVDNGFDTLLPAARLLAQYGRNTESADFIRRRVKAVPWDAEAGLQLARTLPAGSPDRDRLVSAVVADSQATYKLRAEAARMAMPRPVAAVSGTELALLSSASISPQASMKAYQVEARIEAARETSDPEIKLRLWLEALALAPADERVRLGALRAAIAQHQDALSLALDQSPKQPQLSAPERATIAESLAAAAERIDDLKAAQTYLRAAIDLRPANQRTPLVVKLNAITAEQERRTKNAARQPKIKNVIEQDQIVRSAQ